MSKAKKKVVVTTTAQAPKKAEPTVSRRKTTTSSSSSTNHPLVFNRTNYILMLGGIALIALGLILMSGGGMPSPDVWDENIIYSWRRTVLASLVIISGLVLEIYAIFKRTTDQEEEAAI